MRMRYLAAILVLLALAAPASPAQAGGVVTVCDEAHLLEVLADGGTVTFSCSGTITLTAEIPITVDTTIDGSDEVVTISGNQAVRVFTVSPGITLILRHIGVANGSVLAAGGYGGGVFVGSGGKLTVDKSTFTANFSLRGGGIFNSVDGIVIVRDSVFAGNVGRLGGAIYDGGTLSVSSSAFIGNASASGGGGGIFVPGGSLAVSYSTFRSNSAFDGSGGGIENFQGSVTVSGSTFSENVATAGGGIDNRDGGTLVVSNSTFSGNNAEDGTGGALFNRDGGIATVTNSTLSGNSAAGGAGISSGAGTITLLNTIVASNVGSNCSGVITDGGGNLSYPDGTCPGINADPALGPLQTNGGSTKTMEPGPGSAALDAADDEICAVSPVNHRDQRGFLRPQGAHCDIGAVERLPYRIWFPVAPSD